MLLLGYGRYHFPDFESYFTIVIFLDKDDIQLNLKQYKSIFLTYDLYPGVYTIKDLQEIVRPLGGH